MTFHCPDLGSASDWLNQISHTALPIRSSTLIWVVTHLSREFLSLFLFCRETSGSIAKCWLFSQANKSSEVCKTRQTESELSQYNNYTNSIQTLLFIADTKVNDSRKSDYLARYKYFFQKFLMVPLLLNLEIKWVPESTYAY